MSMHRGCARIASWLTVGLILLPAARPILGADSSAPIREALAHPDRPEADRTQDVYRKPEKVLAMVGVAPGMHVADLMSGAGWYTEVLARVVGSRGKVYAQNNRIAGGVYGKELARRLEHSRLPQVVLVDRELENLGLPDEQLDAVFLVQFYHDTLAMEVDRDAMNRGIFRSLKPGGVYCVIDHRTQEGSEQRNAADLHRIDPEIVKREVSAAGFALEIESDILGNPADDHTLSVFDESIRGQTDRFFLKFRKPE
jgi:predicted methyltransferase